MVGSRHLVGGIMMTVQDWQWRVNRSIDGAWSDHLGGMDECPRLSTRISHECLLFCAWNILPLGSPTRRKGPLLSFWCAKRCWIGFNGRCFATWVLFDLFSGFFSAFFFLLFSAMYQLGSAPKRPSHLLLQQGRLRFYSSRRCCTMTACDMRIYGDERAKRREC